ncbi:MAG: Mrp/NBP35 family ATP-binding protein [Lentisphaeria bacterium]|nr:Mrp/NBP35 family ATP-binding protein [Lentisphaeria bacterium]
MSSQCSGSCGSCSSCSSCAQEDKLGKKMALIGRKIFVLSGKGGVGKSSIAAAIALKLAAAGRRVGLLDADFHGPSQPTIFGVQNQKLGFSETSGIVPLPVAGVSLLSIGLLLDDPDQAVVWRGPAKMSVLKQLLEDTAWGELDDLILDFPPGTGDEILSACQLIPGKKTAVVVTTPQEVSLADCRKCLDFCRKLELDVAGIVENMSFFVCPDCGKSHALFSSDGGKKLAESYHLPLLAQLPFDPAFMTACDQGTLPDHLSTFPLLLFSQEKK